MNPKVSSHIENTKKWKAEIIELRKILLNSMLEEELKWKSPCYVYKDSNVIIIGSFKEYCCLTFFKGSLMADPYKILAKPGENSQSARMLKFDGIDKIIGLKNEIVEYIFEAIEIENSGLKVQLKTIDEYEVPAELIQKFKENNEFELAFNNLTPGRQKAYILHFSSSKQEKTRIARIEKYYQRILDGKGILDCVCGLSHRMPSCDGSHKFA